VAVVLSPATGAEPADPPDLIELRVALGSPAWSASVTLKKLGAIALKFKTISLRVE
jgi:hypothetical protein